MSKKLLSVLLFIILPVIGLQAQQVDQIVNYSISYPSYDAISMVVPGVSRATGFGGFQDNPASMAFAPKSYFSFDLSNRYADKTSTFLGNSNNTSGTQTSIGDLGFIYKVPTKRGSLVIGGGYSQSAGFTGALQASGFNSNSTITDLYADYPKFGSLNEAAYNIFAIEDVTTDSSASILRFGDDFANYPGISQDLELVEQGTVGEYSIFLATEFLKGLMVGGSVGYSTGTYSFEQELLESDQQGNYDSQFIDVDGDGQFETDIDKILSITTIETELQSFQARLGMVYQPIENINIGVSYKFPSIIHIDEKYTTTLTTTFDDGTKSVEERVRGNYFYNVPSRVGEAVNLTKISKPAKIKAGVTVSPSNKLNISVAAEHIQHSQMEIKYQKPELSDEENRMNTLIRSQFNDVVNLRGGIEYIVNDYFTPRLGYAYFPNVREGIGLDRQFINGGFSATLTKGLVFDLGIQYSFWDEDTLLYKTDRVQEDVEEEITEVHVMAGIRMAL